MDEISKCSWCGAVLTGNSKFCENCGRLIDEEQCDSDTASFHAPDTEDMPEEPAEETVISDSLQIPRRRLPRRWIIALIIIPVIIASVILVYYTNMDPMERQYREALHKIDRGAYSDAVPILLEIRDYKDSADILKSITFDVFDEILSNVQNDALECESIYETGGRTYLWKATHRPDNTSWQYTEPDAYVETREICRELGKSMKDVSLSMGNTGSDAVTVVIEFWCGDTLIYRIIDYRIDYNYYDR